MSDKPRVVFLDIDGPIISTGCYGVNTDASHMRSSMNLNAIGYVNILCKKVGANLVTNSSHNYHEVKNNDLRYDLIRWGVKEDLFHDNWRTKFPYADITGDDSDFLPINLCDRPSGRMRAIQHWLEANGDHDWVCFDDIQFTYDKRLIKVEFDHGVTNDNIREAVRLFGLEPDGLFW